MLVKVLELEPTGPRGYNLIVGVRFSAGDEHFQEVRK